MKSQSTFLSTVPTRNSLGLPPTSSTSKPPKASIIKKDKKVVQVVLDEESEEEEDKITTLHKFTESSHTISQFDYTY